MDLLTKKAYAKINLALDITGRREDGYHMVRMIMQTVGVYDLLTLECLKDAAGTIEILAADTGKSDTPKDEISVLPLGEDNLVYKAAKVLMERYQVKDGVRITIEKHIPIAAGLAGGSSDCAAAMKGVAELFSLPISMEEMMKIGVTLGADVPYCLMGGTAISEGIGEVLTKLPPFPNCTVVLAKPGIGVSTKEAYGGYDALEDSGASIDHPDLDAIIELLSADQKETPKDTIFHLKEKMGNVLEIVTAKNHPEILALEEAFLRNGANASMMSGSGPTVFALFTEKEAAWKAAEEISDQNLAAEVFVTLIENEI